MSSNPYFVHNASIDQSLWLFNWMSCYMNEETFKKIWISENEGSPYPIWKRFWNKYQEFKYDEKTTDGSTPMYHHYDNAKFMESLSPNERSKVIDYYNLAMSKPK